MTDARRMASTMATDALQGTHAGEGGVTPRPRISPLTRLLVLRLKAAEPERSSASIAAVVGGISEQSVRRLVESSTEAKALTQSLMQTALMDRLEDWARACEVAAEKGYHQPSKDWLEAAQLVEPKPTASTQVSVAPTIVLTMPFALGALTPQPPVIEATAVPVLLAKEDA